MRTPRNELLPPFSACHKMWRCHNREPLLADPDEREAYLASLFRSYARAREQGVRFHAFSLMPNHVHELVSIGARVEPLSDWMRQAHGEFGLAFNRRHGRLGKVSCERPKTVPLGDDRAILTVMFYLDANAPKAGLVGSAWEWASCSHRYYAYGEENRWTKLLDPPQAYLDLGETPEARQAAYLEGYAAYVESTGREEERMDDPGVAQTEAVTPDHRDGQPLAGPTRGAQRATWLERLVEGDPSALPGFGAPAYVAARREAVRAWARAHREARAGPGGPPVADRSHAPPRDLAYAPPQARIGRHRLGISP